MRIHRSLVLSVPLLIPQLRGGQLAFPTQAIAKFEVTLDFCAKANPGDSEKYGKLKKELVKGVTDKEILEMRLSQEYKDAYEQAKGEFAKIPKDKAMAVCTDSLESSK